MDTRFLESFIAVVDSGSIAAAARDLNLTPAAIAQRIRALEDEIEAKLLTRSGRRVAPTAAGEAVAARARTLLREVAELRIAAGGGLPAGELRVGAINTALTGIVPDILSRMMRVYPAIEVYVVPGRSVDIYRQMLDGELDIALMVQPPFRYPKAYSWQELRVEPLILLVSDRDGGHDPFELLRSRPLIRYDRRYWGGRLADGYLRTHKIETRDRLELDSLEAIAVMVDRGLGVALVPDWAPPWPAGLALRRLHLPGPVPMRHIGLFWMRNSPRLALVEAFRRMVAKE